MIVPTRPALMLAILLALVSAAASAQTRHTVEAGDSLFRIALSYNLSLHTVADYNRIEAPYLLHPGDILAIPPLPPCPLDQPPITDRNLCHTTRRCSNDCDWKIGWCMAYLELDEPTCQALFCGRADDPAPAPKRKRPRPAPPVIEAEQPAAPRCIQNSYTTPEGKVIISARDRLCYKECLDGTPRAELEDLGCTWPDA